MKIRELESFLYRKIDHEGLVTYLLSTILLERSNIVCRGSHGVRERCVCRACSASVELY